MQKFGIDLSHHNEGINFDTLKNNGVEFAILRAGYTGYGNGVSKAKDNQFQNFYNQCKDRGIGVGAYWFSCANTYQKGVDEANWMYENCLKGKQFDYPIYIDVEDDTGNKGWLRNAGKEAITDGIIGFCETLENKGYYVGIYANLDWFNNWINLDRVANYDKWLAAWIKNKPRTFLSDTMWQFGGETNQQRSPYLAGQIVDQDYCYLDYPKIIKEQGLNGYPKVTKKVEYRAYIQDIGWQDWKHDGETSGTTKQSKRLEAIQIKFNKDVYAKAHIQDKGWVDFGKITKDTVIGTMHESKRLECLCLKGDFKYRVHIQDVGWSTWTKADGVCTLGSVGQSLRIEAIEIK